MKHILDASNIVFGGHYGSPDYRVCQFPCGGIRKLLGLLNADYAQSEHVICFDGGSTVKKELLPRYKAGRVPNYSVMAQLDLLREILLDCGIPFYWDEQYEADDYICSVVHFLSTVGDTDQIVVISDDRDMACCVTKNVSIRNATTNGIGINYNNYSSRVVRGMTVPYNTILQYKMFYGDKSDNYLGVNVPGLKYEDLAMSVIGELTPYIEDGSFPETIWMDLEVANLVIDGLPDSVSAEAKELLKKQAKIVFPQKVCVTVNGDEALYEEARQGNIPLFRTLQKHMRIMCNDNFDLKKFQMYCSIFGLNRMRLGVMGDKYESAAEDFRRTLSLRAKDLSSGVMAVERYRKQKEVRAAGAELKNMELPL